jgi:CubicO group peptidase (beta-lactamase class C family)
MRNLLPLLAITALAGPASAQDATLASKIGEAARIYLQQEKGTGLAIGIIRDGETSFHNFGSSARGAAPVTEQTEFEIGSIAKTMSGLLLARAVLAGKADLNDDVRKYLDGTYPRLEFQGEPVRLLHLANMTSALPDNLPDLSKLEPDPGRFKRAAALKAYGKARFMADLRALAPREKPGASVGHSNAAAQLLNYILERIYDMPYETILQREIEKPLGFATGPDAKGYDAEGREAAVLPRQHFGDRYSMADMMKYAARQLDERDPAVALSHKGSWFTLDRKTYVGLTWIVSELPDSGRLIRYSGGTWGFSSAMMLYPERRLAIVLMANNASDTAQDRLTGMATLLAGAAKP